MTHENWCITQGHGRLIVEPRVTTRPLVERGFASHDAAFERLQELEAQQHRRHTIAKAVFEVLIILTLGMAIASILST